MSSKHTQAIVWGDDSGLLYDFVVVKTSDQEENVVARPGFTVYYFVERSSSELTSFVGRWNFRFLSIISLRRVPMPTTRIYLQSYYMEKLCKVS